MIYFDNGATSWPKPPSMASCLEKAVNEYGANPGRSAYKSALKTNEMIYETRRRLAAFFNIDDEENVVFSLNATYLLNTIIKGVIKPGQHVLISDLEHNAVYRPLMKLKAKSNITVSTFKVDLYDNKKTLESFSEEIKKDVDAVVTLHTSNVFGRVLPIEHMGQTASQYKSLFIVDACQSAGKIDIDMKKNNIDVLCFSPHKGMLSLMGTGVMLVNNPKLKIDTLVEGGTGGSSADIQMPPFLPDRCEAGTQNVPGIISINCGLDYIEKRTADKISGYELFLCQRLYNQLFQLSEKIIFYTPYPEKDYTGVLSFNVRGAKPYEVSNFLDDRDICVRSGLHCSPLAHKKAGTLPDGTVRVSFGPFNTEKEVAAFVNAVKEFLFKNKQIIF